MRKKIFIKEKQLRAESLKGLEEQRAEALESLTLITNKAETEKRAMTEEEVVKFEQTESLIKDLDKTIEAIKKTKDLIETRNDASSPDYTDEENEVRAFENYIRGIVNERAEKNLKFSENGAIIPTTIANKIIKKVVDIAPIFAKATRYNIKGNLEIPLYDTETQSINMAFAEEFKSLTSSSGKYTSISLKGYLAGALTKVSKSLINNSKFDIISEVINNMADSIAQFVEKVLINGESGKVEGLTGIKQTTTAATVNKISLDEIVTLRDSIKDIYQKNACFIMHPSTRTAIRLLKDTTGRLLVQDDVTTEFGSSIFGKPIYVSDAMPKAEAGKTAIIYGDLTGLAVKLSEESEVQILREKYADEHADGVITWIEFDSKIENQQKLARLVMKEG